MSVFGSESNGSVSKYDDSKVLSLATVALALVGAGVVTRSKNKKFVSRVHVDMTTTCNVANKICYLFFIKIVPFRVNGDYVYEIYAEWKVQLYIPVL